MRYSVRKSVVNVVGRIWLPPITCGQQITLSEYDVRNATDEDGNITRESVEAWLCANAGDFQSIQDFSASIEHGNETVEIPWQTEEGELAYCDIIGE